MMTRVGETWIPKPQKPTLEWLESEFKLPPEAGDLPGSYNPDMVPYLWGIFAALDDPSVRAVAMMKAAQIGWTFGLTGWLFKKISTAPTSIVVLFPKDGAAREYMDQKFIPAVKSTPAMDGVIETAGSRKDGNRALFKKFPGGFLKLAGSNSISNVKSTPAEIVIIEEPDDTNENIKDQGDGIRLARERIKRYRNGKLVLGGTPGVKGISRVEEYISISDQRVLPIKCHECGDKHVLDWSNVSWLYRDTGEPHPVYGMAMPETAIYACPYCGSAWDDYQRKNNIIETVKEAAESGDPFYGWTPTVKSVGGVAGFKELNELYACMPGIGLASVVQDFLEAEHDADTGDVSGRIVFMNSKLARPYEYVSDAPPADELQDRAEDYCEMTVPQGGLLVTAGVDVQHDRLAIVIRAWGRGEESWLVYWGEIYGNTIDKADPVWDELDRLLTKPLMHDSGASLRISAASVDSSDGQTNDAVYHYVRERQRHGVMAVKGASANSEDKEIFSRPRISQDTNKNNTKAAKYGLRPFQVGTHKAKDLIDGRIRLEGTGPGRMHWYEDVRADYWEQLTAEVKAPHPRNPRKRVWQKKAGKPNEALDCEVYALHAARSCRTHVLRPNEWDRLEAALTQTTLFEAPAEPSPQQQAAPRRRSRRMRNRSV